MFAANPKLDTPRHQNRHQVTDALAGGAGGKHLVALRLALANGKDGCTPLRHLLLDQRRKNEQIVQHHSGVIVVRSIKDLPKSQRKSINHRNTTFSTSYGAASSSSSFAYSSGESSDVMRVGGYRLVEVGQVG